jgi:CzcA family heavy metal efflux pump
MKIAETAFYYRKAILLVILILTAAGLYAAFQLPSGIYPEVDFPRIVIIAEAGDLPTGNMLLGITRPLEQAVSGVLGLYRIRSRTIRGEAEISLTFLPRSDMQLALQQVQAKAGEIRPLLPTDTELTIERLTPAIFPVLSYNLTGKGVAPADLRDYALYTIKPYFSRIPGVGQVGVLGDTVREIEVVVDAHKLIAHHITLEEVEEAIRKANVIEAMGRLNKDYKQFLLLMSSEITNLDAIGNIVVAQNRETEGAPAVYLRDIAQIFEGSQDKLMLVTGDGEEAAQINITRQIGGNILDIEHDAIKKSSELKRILPPGLRLKRVYDLAEFIQDSIGSVREAILIGGVLSILILLFFLRDLLTTIIAALSIPITLIITLFFMHEFGQTLNLMSLGGMAVAIGLVIDDAIVVIENIHRHLRLSPDLPRNEVVRAATNEILGAVAGSTFTTVVVFLPLGLVEGVIGQFFAAFSITLSIAVIVSLVISFTVIPLLSDRFLKSEEKSHGKSDRMIQRVGTAYQRVLSNGFAHKTLVFGVTAMFLVLGILIYSRLGSGFLPAMDEGSFVLDYWLPSGTSLNETDRVLHQLEAILKQTPEVDSLSRRTGAELGLFATEQSTGDIIVRLKRDRDRDVEEIMDDVRVRIETALPVVRIEFVQILQDILGDLEGNPDPIEVKIFGEDQELLQQKAEEISEKIEKIPGVVDLFNGVQPGNPEILVEVNPSRAQRAGLNADSISKQVSAALLGEVVTQVRQFDRLIGIRVRFPDDQRFNPDLIQQFPLLDEATGNVIPLNAVATFREINGQNELLRENQRQMIAITARISGTSLGDAIGKMKQILQQVRLPLGYTYELGGQYESQQRSFRQLLMVLFVAVMLVFILLVLQFREFRAAVVILAAAPVSLVGAFLMLWITGTEFNVSSFMGLIMLIGLIVKNGIILIEYTFQVREQQGLSLEEALLIAGKTRLRPILMTTFATLFGLMPLAFGIGAGSEMQKPLALAVIGGLSLSTLVTLIFVPVLLVKVESGARLRPAVPI